MLRIFYLLFFVFLLISNTRAESEPLRLGMMAPLSGDFAEYGAHIKNGILLAQENLKSEGIDTEIFYEDACSTYASS
jgi:ABC-type branched-subunit amino acid transport system substrate-binding protein